MLSLTSVSLSLWASPVQHPKRLVSAYTVDLSPLFKWWTKHEGPRPLSAWTHITGSIVGTNAVGWIVEAKVEGAERQKERTQTSSETDGELQKIILQSPPVEDLTEFERLASELKSKTNLRATLAADESEAKSRAQAVEEQQRASRRNGARARVLAMEDRRLQQTENEAKAQQQPLDQQIQQLKAKLAIYPNTDHFVLDCFALDLKADYQKMPVYDYGRVTK